MFYKPSTATQILRYRIQNTEYRKCLQINRNRTTAKLELTILFAIAHRFHLQKQHKRRDINLLKLETFSSSRLNLPGIGSVFTTLRRANISKLRRKIGSHWKKDWKNIRISTPRLEELRIIGVVNRLSCRGFVAGENSAFGVQKCACCMHY
ncbi:Protein of unknown function [Pyronema omphalodes CBS 100304]|uniref:Uncharacterized protein n=1 Tax=Pyronema omphalodes (strain CBS 100304) TaxID=1076935 RepID=U4LJM8_PYROM|nr:Protein of unknown function [Pyronema omphalodes CBS 100304]